MEILQELLVPLRCSIQNYDWGKKGSSSAVANLIFKEKEAIDEGVCFAELWIGTHPNGPSFVERNGQLLSDFLRDHPKFMGEDLLNRFDEAKSFQLPFLFKILSIEKALSIQAHPDKLLASQLFEKSPQLYRGRSLFWYSSWFRSVLCHVRL